MSRRRYVSTEISTDTAVNRLAREAGDFAALLYTWLIPHADDDCSIPADPEAVMLKVIPGRRDKEPADVAAALSAMVALGLLISAGDRLVFPPSAFYRYQTYIPAEKRRAYADSPDDQRETPTNAAQRRATPEKAAYPSYSPSPSPSPTENTDTHVSVAPDKPDAEPRPRDEYWDTLADLMGDPTGQRFTKTARGERNSCIKEFRDGGYSPAEMRALGLEYQARWPSAEFTPSALKKHAATLARPRPKEASNGQGQLLGPTQEDRRRAADRAEADATAYRAALKGVNGRRAGPSPLA